MQSSTAGSNLTGMDLVLPHVAGHAMAGPVVRVKSTGICSHLYALSGLALAPIATVASGQQRVPHGRNRH